ncbi:MAG: FHA domain-containing protein, partial [Myxococcales bacterium]|nr:FHA domain-containing protein [Myxococcales bacterium]
GGPTHDAGAMQLGLACHVCGQLNALSAQACTRCGTVLAPAPVGDPVAGGYPPTSAQMPPLMRTPIPGAPPGGGTPPAELEDLETSPQARFDPATGQPLRGSADQVPATHGAAAKTMFFGALQQQPVVPRLVVIKGEGGDGATYHLQGLTTTIGRSAADITFSEDPFLSPEHAKFTSQTGRLFVQDLGSVNGVFLRIKKPTALLDGSYLLVGEQLLELRHHPFGDGAPNDEGTYFYGSPRPTGEFQVIQLLAGGGTGRTVTADGGSLSMGREGNTMNFPDDRFISGHHARLDASSDGDHVLLTDTGSRNGTFIRLTGAQELFHGDYLFVGQQLLRVEIA